MKPFSNKVALVTGASSGIGHSTAVLYAERGAQVVETLTQPLLAGPGTHLALCVSASSPTIHPLVFPVEKP